MEYLVVTEHADDRTCSAFVPDLPGCVTSGATVEETQAVIREAIQLPIKSLREHGEPVPSPSAVGELVGVRPAAGTKSPSPNRP
jgi:predicted RNase H-like HicB family nuclease